MAQLELKERRDLVVRLVWAELKDRLETQDAKDQLVHLEAVVHVEKLAAKVVMDLKVLQDQEVH